MAKKKNSSAETTELRCHRCGAPLTPENSREESTEYSRTGISPLCIDCEQKYFDKLAEVEGKSLALFHCCAAFNVPCKPIVLADTDFDTNQSAWILYIDCLADAGEDRKVEEVLTFFDGETNILRVFGRNFTERDFAKYIQTERNNLERLPGTAEQRARWGENENWTTQTYNELDRLYEARASSYAGQTITPQMKITLIKVAKWDREIDELIQKNKYKDARDLQSMVDSVLSSEQMRKKDEKPVEHFRPDAWVAAMERKGLMRDGKFLTLDETIKVLREYDYKRKKYKYPKEAADQLIANWVKYVRRNGDLRMAYALPRDMQTQDDYAEFEREPSEEYEKKVYDMQLEEVQFTDPPLSEGEDE